MDNIKEYLKRTKSAVLKIYEARRSYLEILPTDDETPAFLFSGDPDSEENKKAYKKWREDNQDQNAEMLKKENEFVYEFLAMSILSGAILQFAFWGIDKFSNNKKIAGGFEDIIGKEPNQNKKAIKFCVGRLCDEIPIGLIIYAGRNQAIHFYDQKFNSVTNRVFENLANYYSPLFNKRYKDDKFDLNNPHMENYAENIIYTLSWFTYEKFEQDMLDTLA
jgi:hypothetical protein